MANTFHYHNGQGSGNTDFTYTFPTIKKEDVKVKVSDVLVDNYTILSYTQSGTKTVRFDNTTGSLNSTVCDSDGSPKSGSSNVYIYRDTDVDARRKTYTAGESVKAADLNEQTDQLLYATQEEQNQLILTDRIKDSQITSAKILDATIVDADVNASAEIQVSKLKDGVARQVIETSADGTTVAWTSSLSLPGTVTVNGTDGSGNSIVTTGGATFAGDVNIGAANLTIAADNKEFAVQNNAGADKFTVDTDNGNTVIAGTLAAGATTVTGNIAVSGTVDGRDVATDGTKLDGIEASATADQTNAEIRAAVEAASDSNVFTDADHTKLNGIEASATADQTGAEIKSAYEGESNTNAFTDANKALVDAITADATEINKIDGYTGSTANLNIVSGKTFRASTDGTLTTTSDTEIPSSKVINNRIAAIADSIGGFVPIATKDDFPTSNPDPKGDAGTVVSIVNAVGISVDSSGQGTLATRSGGSDAVIINGFPNKLRGGATIGTGGSTSTNANPYIIPADVGLQVQTTSTAHTYTYHKVLAVEQDVVELQDAIQSFNARYRINTSDPGSNNQVGDLFYHTGDNEMKVYNGSTWVNVAATGNFKINTLQSTGTAPDGGGNTFNGTRKDFGLDYPPTVAAQLIVSINGVVQKPNTGSSRPSEGFAWDSNNNKLLLATAPATGSDYYIVTMGQGVNTAVITNGSVTTAKLADNAVDGTKIAMGSDAQGDVIYYNGTDYARLAAGTAGQALKTGGSGANPSWGDVSTNDGEWALAASGSAHYVFTGSGLTGNVNDPNLYLRRGGTYTFMNNTSGTSHPFRIQSAPGTSGAAYNTGVTNNSATGGVKLTFEVPQDAPDKLYYQCTDHENMQGALFVTGDVVKGGGYDQAIHENENTINTAYTISDGHNALCAGPITIANAGSVTTGNGEYWHII